MFHKLHVLGMNDDLWDNSTEQKSKVQYSIVKYNIVQCSKFIPIQNSTEQCS